jgi:hypothetical protein
MSKECGAVGGMRIGRGNRVLDEKPTPLPFYPSFLEEIFIILVEIRC